MALEGFRGSILSLLNDDSNTEHALSLIDKEVEDAKAYMRALWRRRNTFVPISRFPPEILARVFEFVKEGAISGSMSWIRVGHVCHLWREIAINSPSLWTKPPLIYTSWTKEMLSRSKMASLKISADFCSLGAVRPNAKAESLFLVVPHASRIETLELSHYNSEFMQKFLSGMPKAMPKLELLKMEFFPVAHSTSSDSVLSMDHVCEADRLRRIDLTRCSVSWDSHFFGPKLVHLKVTAIPIIARPTIDQFLHAFSRMPALETVELREALPVKRSSGHSSEPPKIFLNSLRFITIQGTSMETEHFLSAVSFPPTVTVKISCKAETKAEEQFRHVLAYASALSSASTSHPGAKIRTLEVSPGTYAMTGHRSQFKTFSSVLSDSGSYTPPNLELDLLTVERQGDHLVGRFCAAMPLTNLVMLRLHSTSLLSPTVLAETFGILPNLRSVFVSGELARNFVMALMEVRSNQVSTKVGTISLYFPSLRSMSLSDVNFDGQYEDMTVDLLQDCLMWRYECGAEIRQLKLSDCSRLESDSVDLFREIVVDVEWDEVECGFTESEEEEDIWDQDSYDDYFDDPYYSDDDVYPFGWY